MNLRTRLPSAVMIVLAFGALTVFLSSLSGCALDSNPVSRWVSSVTGTHGLPSETLDELEKFEEVYRSLAVEDETTEEQFEQFIDAFKVIRRSYVNPTSDVDLVKSSIDALNNEDKDWLNKEDGTPNGKAKPEKVIDIALDRMMSELDPHSSYLTAQEFQELLVDTSGEFGGLGIEVQQGDGFLQIVSPIEDTPAFRAGIKAGDKITHIDGVSIKEWDLARTVKILRGKPGSVVVVRIEREGSEAFDLDVVRDIIQVKAVKSTLYDDLLHLRVVSFSERTETDARRAISDAQDTVGDNLKGVVLDLRNNPGGLLQQSVALSDMFLNDGGVVSIRGREADDVRNYSATQGDVINGLPLVVLINGGSASASEIVSGALQDRDRAILMGRKTFGKGSVQTIMPLTREGAVRITTALYYLPSGRTIQKVGVTPDIFLDLPPANDNVGEGDEKGEAATAVSRREADLPNVLNAQQYATEPEGQKHGDLGHASVQACPEFGEAKDRELGCAIEFLKAGSAQRFLASLTKVDQG